LTEEINKKGEIETMNLVYETIVFNRLDSYD